MMYTLPRGWLGRALCENANVQISWPRHYTDVYPASSMVQSPSNARLSPCVNGAGNCLDNSQQSCGHVDDTPCLLHCLRSHIAETNVTYVQPQFLLS